jgi:hypothetical protein
VMAPFWASAAAAHTTSAASAMAGRSLKT